MCWRQQVCLLCMAQTGHFNQVAQQHGTWRRIVLRLHMRCRNSSDVSPTTVCM